MSAINISDEDIQYSEQILLTRGRSFGPPNSERCLFIKNADKSMDLQAVPGSGKTTALMAKLLIFEKYMPFSDGSGILVISHTNAAIDEIKKRIGNYCPHLFSYPNYIGTIQSFVNDFFTKPYYQTKNRKKIQHIDDKYYKNELERKLRYLKGCQEDTSKKIWNIKFANPKLIENYRFAVEGESYTLVEKMNGEKLIVSKPKVRAKIYKDYTDPEKQSVLDCLKKLKYEIMKSGILHYDDAYFLADRYLQKMPTIKSTVQKRFKYVFVDEMQDMDTHQCEILDKIFYDDGKSDTIYQRIGDKNQAIYSGDVKLEEIWEDRNVSRLSGSYRLTKEVGDVVQPFALDADFYIEGKNIIDKGPLLPHLLIYESDSTQCCVIQKYVDLVKNYQKQKKIPDDYKIIAEKPIAAIAWRKEHEEDNKICLKDYCPMFNQETIRPKEDYDCLESFFVFFDNNEKGLKSIHKNIINAILRSIRLSSIKFEEQYFTKKRLLDYLKENNGEQGLELYDELQKQLYKWSMGVIRGQASSVMEEVKVFIRKLFKTLWPRAEIDESFLNTRIKKDTVKIPTNVDSRFDCGKCSVNGRKIYINTIHSVKGKTHTATLYLESNNRENHGIAYESQRLADQFVGIPFKDNKVWHRKSAKMAYVGFSRPTHFLCVAITKDHFLEMENKIDRNIWAVESI